MFNSAIVFSPREKGEIVYFGKRPNRSHTQVDSVHGIAWSFTVYLHLEECDLDDFRDLGHSLQHSLDQRQQTSIGCKHPKTIDGAREATIFRHDKPLRLRFFVSCQMRMLRRHKLWSKA